MCYGRSRIWFCLTRQERAATVFAIRSTRWNQMQRIEQKIRSAKNGISIFIICYAPPQNSRNSFALHSQSTIYRIKLRRRLMQSMKFNQSIFAIVRGTAVAVVFCSLSSCVDRIRQMRHRSAIRLAGRALANETSGRETDESASHRRAQDERRQLTARWERCQRGLDAQFWRVSKSFVRCMHLRSSVRKSNISHSQIIHIYASSKSAKCSNVAGGIFYVA